MNFKKNKLSIFHLAIILFLASLSACSFSERASLRLYNRAAVKTYDMVIVPGIPLGSSLTWDTIMKGRVCWAKFLYDKGIAKNIMFSGAAVHTPYYEAMVMALYAKAIGIPKEHIFTEMLAEHSVENIYYSYKKSKKLGFRSIALASDPYQSKQLRSFAYLRLNRSIGIIPFVYDTLQTVVPKTKDPVIDYKQAFKKDFVSLEKRQTRWKRIKGTIGWNRDKKAYQ
jgi:uncharacterized SAM-binding protein YcdF (DUF218 family)